MWGRASYGRLGLGPGARDAYAPVEVQLPGGHQRWKIAAATAGEQQRRRRRWQRQRHVTHLDHVQHMLVLVAAGPVVLQCGTVDFSCVLFQQNLLLW